MDTPIEFMRLAEVQRDTGLGRAQVYALIARGVFPAPVKLVEGCRASAWVRSEVQAYMQARIAARATPHFFPAQNIL